jgi:YfiH family protein
LFTWVEDRDLLYLKIDSFAKYAVEAYFTTRNGGVSIGAYNSLNLALHVGDKKEDVLNNRVKLANSLGFDSRTFVAAEQVHGGNTYIVTEKDQGAGALDFQDSIPGVDALITAKKGIPLISFYADCVPLFFLDPVKRVVALAHAGWRGTVKKIARQTVLQMQEAFSSSPENIMVALGPSISRDYYEVNERVIEEFRRAFPWYKELLVYKGKEHYLLDLWQANILILEETGVGREKIFLSNLCTFGNPQLFYSYRREAGKTGRMASIIYLPESKD